ncbi:Cys/Met metabolism PLP-dependent enzyme-domain-containing protein [Coemansia spiralis]|nr:Cys/Met metabolism PLP-dependent enzyme-domain-containing protein [Coemansia spiralis]
MSVATQSIHADSYLRVTSDITPPINVTTNFDYARTEVDGFNYGPDQRYVYSRDTTPIVTKVEAALSTITEGYAVLYGSGLTAILAVLIEHKPKKIALGESYFGTRKVVEQYQALVPGVEVVGIECGFEGVNLVWIESPFNPTGEVKDIGSYALRAHAAGALLVVDSTLAPPPLSYPFRQGADIVVHSATKYLGGHCDLLAGVVVTKSARSTETMRAARNTLGLGAGSLEGWLLLRSLRTLTVRVKQQSQTTARLVALLESFRRGACASSCHQPTAAELSLGLRIASVQHASLQFLCSKSSSKCGFDVLRQHPEGFGAVFAVRFASKSQALFVARHLKLHRFATSLGGVESLVDWRHGWDASADPTLLRVSVGLESYEDLANDWRQALLALDATETGAKL